MKQDNIKQSGFRALTDNEIVAVSGGSVEIKAYSKPIARKDSGGSRPQVAGPQFSDGYPLQNNNY